MPKITDREMKQLEKLRERQKSQNEYLKGKYDRVNITVNKGYKELIKETADAMNMSVNEFCREAIVNAVNNYAVQNTQEPKIDPKNQNVVENTLTVEKSENGEIKRDSAGIESLAELQALTNKRRAEQEERKREIEERKAQAEKERQEEFQVVINGVVEDLKARSGNGESN